MNETGRLVIVALVVIAAGPVVSVIAGGGTGNLTVWAGATLVFAVTGWLFLRSLPRS